MIFPQLTILVHPGGDTKRARVRGRSKRDQKNVYAQKKFLFELQLSHNLGLGVRAWEFAANPLVFWSSHALFFLFIFFFTLSPRSGLTVLLHKLRTIRTKSRKRIREIHQLAFFFFFISLTGIDWFLPYFSLVDFAW